MVLLGDKIRDLRKSARYTQDELAGRINVAKASISAYERNVRQPSLDVIISIARVFNVSTDYLLLGKQDMVIEISDLNDEQRKNICEAVKLYKIYNSYCTYIKENNLTKDFLKSIEE